KVNIIDMRKELYQKHYASIFSRPLKERIERVLAKKQQAILFLNRRGFSTFIHCRQCGIVIRCKRCDAVMVYHYSKKRLVCHYCNANMQPPQACPKCKGQYIKYFGMGTERVESEIHRYFPEGNTDRMDTDTTKKRGSHEKVLKKFKNHSINILVGTQMIAKGLDFPKVTLVGVISADTTLNLPDFRASERTFNLLTQVAGRAGRGDEGGEVIIQTYTPHHYAITAASQHDYHSFYNKEVGVRRELDLPPFVSIIRVIFKSRKEERASGAAKEMAGVVAKAIKDVKILGPAPAAVSKVRNKYIWSIVLKTRSQEESALRLKAILKKFKRPSGVSIVADVDPISL
ncbi:MAG: primosomal protein N', partial [Candidatus Omnitrophota bacterium]